MSITGNEILDKIYSKLQKKVEQIKFAQHAIKKFETEIKPKINEFFGENTEYDIHTDDFYDNFVVIYIEPGKQFKDNDDWDAAYSGVERVCEYYNIDFDSYAITIPFR